MALSATPFLNGCGEVIEISQLGGVEVILTWETLTKNADGTNLTDLAGYRIYYSHTSGGSYPYVVTVGPDETMSRIQLPNGGRWYFFATAFDNVGNESLPSNEISTEISF
jgi:hypothetical protein